MWNLAMHEMVNKSNSNYYQQKQSQNPHNQSVGKRSSSKSVKNACWKFNRNESCKPGCNFEHKCSYCGSYAHAVIDCPKLKGKFDKKADGTHHAQTGQNHANTQNRHSNSNGT